MLRELLHPLSVHIKLVMQTKKWKKYNKNNKVIPISLCDISKIKVGLYSYGDIDVHTFGNPDESLVIGNYCSITNGCSFVLSGEHSINRLLSYPVQNDVMNNAKCKGPIIIDDDVWIGYGCIIMSGVHIGQGAVVAAGAVVTKDVPPYAVVGGVPAKIIRYRFKKEMIAELMKIDYCKLTKEIVNEHIDEFCIDLQSVDKMEWLPKR